MLGSYGPDTQIVSPDCSKRACDGSPHAELIAHASVSTGARPRR